MCTGAEAALLFASAASTAVAVDNARDAKKEAASARARIEGDRLKAETEAAQRASAQTQMARRALAKNSLFTGGGTAAGGGAKSTLGVG